MLKHEEMIENVHRRIAQYEEEKKMKHSKFKNIFSTKKQDSKNEVNTPNEDGYIEVVSGTERIKTSNRMIRIVSTVAACSVLAAGIGATGVLLNKNKANRSALSEKDVVCTETPETTVYKLSDNGTISPFIDFRQIYFGIGCLNNFDYVEYSDATYDNLAVFLNNFNWGEGNDISENEVPDFDNYEGNGYMINWRKGDVWFYVYVMDYGKAYYYMCHCEPDGGNYYYPISGSVMYDIDYAAFDKGIKEIWSNDVPDTSKYISKRERMYLTQGEFINATVQGKEGASLDKIVSKNEKSSAALQGFIREDFVGMLQNTDPVEDGNNIDSYEIACYYKTSDTTTRRLTYYIGSNGSVSLCEYELTDTDSIPTGCTNYYIDINELETVLNDIVNGKYDDKYSFEPTTTAVTTSITKTTSTTVTSTTVTTTEQNNSPEEETEEVPTDTEQSDKELFRNFYLSEHNGHDGSLNGTYEVMDENGNPFDYKTEINYMLHSAEILPIDRVLGTITDEDDAIAKGREILLNIYGHEYINNHEKEYIVHPDGTKIYRDKPYYMANYHEDYDIWEFYPTLFSGSSEDGHYHTSTPGTVSRFYIRGCDGKLLACWR